MKYVKKMGFEKAKCIEVDKVDHFNIIENLSDDTFLLTKVFCKI
jgi:hypothetical protein